MKKVLSMLVAVVLLLSVMSICANAEAPLSYTCSAEVAVEADYTLTDIDGFNVSVRLNNQKIFALDNASDDYTCTINSIKTPDGTDYLTDPEKFFETYTVEDFSGSYIKVDFTVDFVSDLIFGELEYTVNIDGFSGPTDLGGDLGGLLGGATSDIDVKLPTTITHTDYVTEFPKMIVSSIVVTSIPQKNNYTDAEKYDPSGLEITLSLNNGKSGKLVYGDSIAHAFSFIPSEKENLTPYDTEVAMFLNGVLIGYSPITVEHQLSKGPVNITTYKYTEENPGYHAIVCEGCGETHDAQPHTPKYDEWTYNNDQTFVANGTESNVCADCGTILTRDTFGTADFNTVFADMHFFKVIFEYINVLLRFIGAAVN